mmetsp:Transcript_9173/g.27610  ORF Transcript_9173/g.27610 Transcript_9173/m.27610 type:complete len:223 (+) Transcript_9173:1407-2075(+)
MFDPGGGASSIEVAFTTLACMKYASIETYLVVNSSTAFSRPQLRKKMVNSCCNVSAGLGSGAFFASIDGVRCALDGVRCTVDGVRCMPPLDGWPPFIGTDGVRWTLPADNDPRPGVPGDLSALDAFLSRSSPVMSSGLELPLADITEEPNFSWMTAVTLEDRKARYRIVRCEITACSSSSGSSTLASADLWFSRRLISSKRLSWVYLARIRSASSSHCACIS